MLLKPASGAPEWVLQSTSLANSKAGAVSCARAWLSARSLPACLPLLVACSPRHEKETWLPSLSREHTDWTGGGAGAVRAPVRWKGSSAMTWASAGSTEGRGVRAGKATAGSPRQHSLRLPHWALPCTEHCCSLTNANGPRTCLGFPRLAFLLSAQKHTREVAGTSLAGKLTYLLSHQPQLDTSGPQLPRSSFHHTVLVHTDQNQLPAGSQKHTNCSALPRRTTLGRRGRLTPRSCGPPDKLSRIQPVPHQHRAGALPGRKPQSGYERSRDVRHSHLALPSPGRAARTASEPTLGTAPRPPQPSPAAGAQSYPTAATPANPEQLTAGEPPSASRAAPQEKMRTPGASSISFSAPMPRSGPSQSTAHGPSGHTGRRGNDWCDLSGTPGLPPWRAESEGP